MIKKTTLNLIPSAIPDPMLPECLELLEHFKSAGI